MDDRVKVLEEAISGVGYWMWWVAELPSVFQVEFGGTRLWTPPHASDRPPSGQVALQFASPRFIAFLAGADLPDELPADWPNKLHQDELEPLTISYGDFTVSSIEKLNEIASKAAVKDIILGEETVLRNLQHKDAFLGFWAGAVGLVIVANEMRVLTHEAVLTLDDIEQKHSRWWGYWKEYWSRRDTHNPMPKDYACEATIPVKEA